MQNNRSHNDVPIYDVNHPLEDLQRLVLGLNPAELEKLQLWLKDKDKFTGDISHILPDAVVKSFEKDKSLSDALLPVIESAIFLSVQKNPEALANALYPIMGPAIRQSIADTFRKMIQSLNDTLEKQFSIERIKWRLEASFSSKSYAEIVLLKGHKFNVLASMLIHKESGLLIQEVHNDNQDFDEADMISSMLKAVQDFVHDSFNNHINDSDTLDSLRLNELNVWIIDGPFAFLAVVIDGDAPESKRDFFKSQLEIIHHKFGDKLINFDGDTNSYTDTIPVLNNCLIGNNAKRKASKSNLKLLITIIIIIILISGWISYSIYKNHQRNNIISSLEKIESVVIVNHKNKDGKLVITAMKDVSLTDADILSKLSKPDTSDYKINWINFLSTDSKFIIARFKKYLSPENSVSITMNNNTMTFTGKASPEWIEKAKDYTKMQSGLFTADFSKLQQTEDVKFTNIKQKINSFNIKFKNGVSILNKAQKLQLDTLISLIQDYNRYEEIKNITIIVNLDIEGNKDENLRFANSRKRHIINYLVSKHIDLNTITYEIVNTENNADARKISFKIIPK